MTVAELIAKLREFPMDAIVYTNNGESQLLDEEDIGYEETDNDVIIYI